MLRLMGLQDRVYWIGHFLSCLCHCWICSTVAIIFMLFANNQRPISPDRFREYERSLDYGPFLVYEKTSVSLLAATFFIFSVQFSLHAMMLSSFLTKGEYPGTPNKIKRRDFRKRNRWSCRNAQKKRNGAILATKHCRKWTPEITFLLGTVQKARGGSVWFLSAFLSSYGSICYNTAMIPIEHSGTKSYFLHRYRVMLIVAAWFTHVGIVP